MLKRYLSGLLVCAAFCFLPIISCSGSNDPITPVTQPALSSTAAGSSESIHQLWGLYDVIINPDTLEAEISSIRNAQFTCNVTQFLQAPLAPVELIGIKLENVLTDMDSGYIVCDVTLRHPFPGITMYRGFDVRGIVMGDGSLSLEHDSSVLYAGPDDLTLLNPDGYTRWWNPSEFDAYGSLFGYQGGTFATPGYTPSATINPYKYFADELDPFEEVNLDPDSRGTFSTFILANTRRYFLQFPVPGGQADYRFSYAVDASWSPPAQSAAPDYPISSFSPDANCAEPYKVILADAGSDAWYIDETNNGGSLLLNVEVFDWQSINNDGGVADEISAIWLEGDIFETPVNLLDISIELPGGPVSGIFQAQIDNVILTHSGTYDVWIIVESASPDSYEPNIPLPTSPYSWPDALLSAYFTGSVEIASVKPEYSPTITGISPDEGIINTEVPATIYGAYFESGCSVKIIESIGLEPFIIEASNEITNPTGQQISCTLNLDGAPVNLYDIMVTNPSDLSCELIEGFEITATGSIIYVDSSNVSGTEDGTMLNPWSTIQDAIDSADFGAIIWVDDSDTPYVEQVTMADGVDLISVNWDSSDGDEQATIKIPLYFDTCVFGADSSLISGFEIIGRNASWQAKYGIVCDGTSTDISFVAVHGFHFLDASGIYITNGASTLVLGSEVYDINNNTYNSASKLSGIYVQDCDNSVSIQQVTVHQVFSSGYYDGMNCHPSGIRIDDSDGVTIHNAIVYNITGGYNNEVSAIRVGNSENVLIQNCTVFDIYKTFNLGNTYGLYMYNCTDLDARNMIICYVRKSLSEANGYGVSQSNSTYTFDYSDIFFCSTDLYNNVIPGENCISLNPYFVNTGGGNFHLIPTSPCINAGDPMILDPDGTTSDIGAYGGPLGNW